MTAKSIWGSFPDRWKSLSTQWPERAILAAGALNGIKSIADIGCGAGSLRAALPDDIGYTGIDIVARDSNTIVVDLNNEQLPKLDVDAVAMLGVIEYIDEPERVLAQFREFPKSVITYNHYSFLDVLWTLGLKKRQAVWRHRHTRRAFRALLEKAGLEVVSYTPVRYGEGMYLCVPRQREAAPAQGMIPA